MENHQGSIDVQFHQMPPIKLVSYEPDREPSREPGIWERLTLATRRREFTLVESWQLELDKVRYEDGLNGTVEVPAKDSDLNTIVFDGASIPVPWLISLLTLGILRPLGVTLIGSIVHDYAYRFGKLKMVDKDNNYEFVQLERDKADKLFRDIIGTINGLPPVGYIAWLAVRIGWLWVPYNGKRFTGKKPVFEYIFVLLLLLGLFFIYRWVGFSDMLTGIVSIYFGLYLFGVALRYYYSARSSIR